MVVDAHTTILFLFKKEKDMKKFFLFLSFISTTIILFSSAGATSVKKTELSTFCSRFVSSWESLGTHFQLIIQLILVLIAFYSIMMLVQCKKNCNVK